MSPVVFILTFFLSHYSYLYYESTYSFHCIIKGCCEEEERRLLRRRRKKIIANERKNSLGNFYMSFFLSNNSLLRSVLYCHVRKKVRKSDCCVTVIFEIDHHGKLLVPFFE